MRALLLMMCLTVGCSEAHADHKYTDTEVMAITFVGEAGWDYDRDHRAIAWVFQNRIDRVYGPDRSLREMAIAYSRGTWRGGRPRALWLRGMRESCDVPIDWPYGKARWEKTYRRKCETVVVRAIEVVAALEVIADPCNGQALHFGFEGDGQQGRMRRIDCGETKNIYYTVDYGRKP